MEPDLKPILIRATERNNESQVKRLIDDGADVNETDDQDKTALFYAAQNNNEGIAVSLIDAGANVDARDNQDKTALFYAAAITSTEDECGILTALVEKGEACVDAPDIYGRTPLFYAITNSMESTRYLLDNEANVHAEDNCNVSILTYVLEHCLMKPENRSNSLSEVLSLLAENGLEKQSIVQSMLNLVFCKAPVLLCSDEKETAIPGLLNISKQHLLNTLTVAIRYLDERSSKKKDMILKTEEKIRRGEIVEALELLRKLRANPNSTDTAGNTALHYTTTLPLMGVPQDSVMKICEFLRKKGAHFNKPNHQSQTPLLFFLSPNNWKLTSPSIQRSGTKTLVDVCAFLLRNGSKLSETLKNKENVFHLLIKLFQQVLDLRVKAVRECVLQELIKLLEVFGEKGESQGKIGNDHDENGNSPLHLWATLTLPSPQEYTSSMCENYTFEKFLKLVLDSLLKCGANVNDRNHKNETPLHLCNTWTAVKLLLDAGARNPNDVDLLGRSPLLVAAKNGFYSDVVDLNDPKRFWKNAVLMGLNPFISNNDESVLHFLLESESFSLAKGLVDVGCEEKFIQDDTTFVNLLDAIRKVESLSAHSWKQAILEVLLKSRNCKSALREEDSYRRCFMNMIGISDQEFQETKDASEHEREKSIGHPLKNGSITKAETPRDFTCPESQDEVSETFRIDCPGDSFVSNAANNTSAVEDQSPSRSPKRRAWCAVSKKHKEKLEKVFIRQEIETIQTISYHKEPIAGGGFGFVFVGIDENDGREVAIKRIQDYKVEEQEMQNLTRLAACDQVVRYLYYIPEENFSYIVSELMEGTLEEYLGGDIDESRSVQICKDVVKGLRFLHDQHIPIIHRDLKPANILYKTHPELCLKIADFGLSLLLHSSCDESKKRQIAGTRCWRAPEVFCASNSHDSCLASADMFCCGLLLHYILSKGKHPFSPDANKRVMNASETEENIKNGEMVGWDDSLSPEATHLVKSMLESNQGSRPSARKALEHPLFWQNDRKIDLLIACSQEACSTAVMKDLNKTISTVVKHGTWNDQMYSHMPAIFDELEKEDSYNTGSVADLVRFIGCAYVHLSDHSESIKTWLCQDFVFLEYFPDLVIEVYKAVTNHDCDQTRKVITKLMLDNEHLFSQKVSSTSVQPSCAIPWVYFSKVHHEKLAKVAREEECKEVNQYLYHEDPIATGRFGQIFAGINKRDGREVAIKRIDRMRIQKPEDKREIRNLTFLADCGQVVFYLLFFETEKFSYVIMELMEGNLDELLDREFDKSKSILLYKEVVQGIKYLHEYGILHRDLKPGNILYKVYPKLCLKLADFGLSRRIDSTSSVSVCGSNVGTRRWIAPEVLSSSSNHSKSSDNFACGLIAFYIFTFKRHPFSPVHCDSEIQSCTETEDNIIRGKMKGWDDSLSPEATHLIKMMLDSDANQRPSAEESLQHPLFWPNKEKINFLKAVGNRSEFECPRSKRTLPLTSLESDLEERFSAIVKYGSWDDPSYKHMPTLYTEMMKKRAYDTKSIVELVRFVRNAYENVSKETRPTPIRNLLLENFVFFEYFPDLMMEVYKASTSSHGSDKTRENIPQTGQYDHEKPVWKDFVESTELRSSLPFSKVEKSAGPSLSHEDHLTNPIEINRIPILIPWASRSRRHKDKLAAVARRQECRMVEGYWYHRDHIGSGAFGRIFAGINEKDGREVAIKRMEKLRMQRPEDKREIQYLTALADCEQVVRYLSFFEDEHFSYIVLELMEGNLYDCLCNNLDLDQRIQLCQDVVMGINYLHKHYILHRDVKPSNILYKVHPNLCVKIADFGLSRQTDRTYSATVYGTNAGTRCWIAPEVLMYPGRLHSPSSDVFSCGLVLHYILSVKRHPFNPTDCARKSELQVVSETESNLMNGVMEGWDDSLSPEATHLVKKMLVMNEKDRPSAEEALEHPLFWARNGKIDFLVAVGNQPEFECRRVTTMRPLTFFVTNLESCFGTIVTNGSWNDPRYTYMPSIYTEMTARRSGYDTHSIVELVRFIRNAYTHISLGSRPTPIKRLLLEDYVFLEYFPDLLIEVYKAVTTHGWDQTREEIKYSMKKI